MSFGFRKPALFPNLWIAHLLQVGWPTQLPPPVTMLASDQRAAPAVPTFCLLLHGAYQNPQNGGFSEVKASAKILLCPRFSRVGGSVFIADFERHFDL